MYGSVYIYNMVLVNNLSYRYKVSHIHFTIFDMYNKQKPWQSNDTFFCKFLVCILVREREEIGYIFIKTTNL